MEGPQPTDNNSTDDKATPSHLQRGEGPQMSPVWVSGKVVRGFGRGSKQLGIPTANLPVDECKQVADLPVGVYYGWAFVPSRDSVPRKAAVSIGWNPFYKNTHKTLEVHLMHNYAEDFYGEELRVVLLGYTRPECDFSSLDALIEAINEDIAWTSRTLDRPEHASYPSHSSFSSAAASSSSS